MTTETAEDWLVSASIAPSLDEDDAIAPLYVGAARGALTLPFCGDCGEPVELEQRVCDRCTSTAIEWRDTDLTGIVHAVTVVHRLEPGLIRFDRPYPVLDVEVASGHRLVMTTVEPVAENPTIGQRVEIDFRHVGLAVIPAARIIQEN
ncbi:MAG: hypothetical protein JWM76_5026 [Pseudonocardiales bacterium]|nr:hypothetical protein [Pseudonocardiales bacterium]